MDEARLCRALGGALHQVAEERMPREGKVPPATFQDPAAARILGSLAQAFDRAALALEEDELQRLAMIGQQPRELQAKPDA